MYESKRKLENLWRLRKTPELLQMSKRSWGAREKHCVYLGCSCLRQCSRPVLGTLQGIRWVLGRNQFSHSYVLNLTLILRSKICSFVEETQKKQNRGVNSPSSHPDDNKSEGKGGLLCELSALLHLVSPKHPLAAGGTPRGFFNSLSQVDIQQLPKTAGVVIEDGSCVSKTLQDG